MSSRHAQSGQALLGFTLLLFVLMGVVLTVHGLTVSEAPAPQQLRVVTRPPGATVMLDGRFAGVTRETQPVILHGVGTGAHLLRVEKAGFAPLVRRLVIVPGKSLEPIELTPLPTGSVRVETTPLGAEVWVDGEWRGISPLTVPGLGAGRHRIRLRLTNHVDKQVAVEIRGGETVQVHRELVDRIEQFYLSALAAEPERIAHHTDLGHFYFVNGKMDLAIKYFGEGLRLCYRPGANYRESRRHHSEIKKHHRWEGIDSAPFKEALRALDREFREARSEGETPLDKRVKGYLRHDDLNGVIRACRKAIKKEPEDPDPRVTLGRFLLRNQQGAEATEAFHAAIKLQPGSVQLRLDIGRKCWSENLRLDLAARRDVLGFAAEQLAEALTLSRDALVRADILSLRSHFLRAQAAVAMEDQESSVRRRFLEAAVQDLTRAVELRRDPLGKARDMVELAETHLLLEQKDQAQRLFREVLDMRDVLQDDASLRRRAETGWQKLK